MKTRIIYYACIAISVALFSCEESSVNDSSITDTTTTLDDSESNVDKESEKQVKDILHSVPSPMEMAAILKKAGANYDPNMLNDVKNVNEYSSAQKQALNLGVYGADLSYASVFNQNQESILYLSCTKKIADKLGLSKAFNDDVIERMEINIDDRDSLLSIISETYYNLDSYLKENKRDHISAMIIASGWIEGLYLGTQLASTSEDPTPELLTRIAEQKVSLENLLALVSSYNSAGELEFVLADLQAISEIYEKVSIDNTDNTVNVGDDGVTTIGGPVEVDFAKEDLQELAELVSAIRSKYVQV